MGQCHLKQFAAAYSGSMVGQCHLTGFGVAGSAGKVGQWHLKGYGVTCSKSMVGWCHLTGFGVACSKVKVARVAPHRVWCGMWCGHDGQAGSASQLDQWNSNSALHHASTSSVASWDAGEALWRTQACFFPWQWSKPKCY